MVQTIKLIKLIQKIAKKPDVMEHFSHRIRIQRPKILQKQIEKARLFLCIPL